MATTKYGVNDALAVKAWAKALAVEALKATSIAPLMGTKKSSILYHRRELSKSAGDKITYGLRMQLSGAGVTEGQTLEGNEEALTTYSDALYINQIRHGVRVKGNKSIDNQRILFDARSEARDDLKDWFTKRYSVSFFNQVCGNTLQTDTKFTGLNATSAPTNYVYPGTASDEQSITNSDTFNLNLIDYAREKAKTMTPPIQPVREMGEDLYVIYLHPYQVTDMRTNTSTGQWLDIQKAVMQGGKYGNSKNPIFTGALGVYNGVVIREAIDEIPSGVNSSTGAEIATVKRAVFLGAQAACFAEGQAQKGMTFKWVEKTFDYDDILGVAGTTIFGIKKTVFNSNDFGCIVVPTYAAAHA